MTSFKRPSCPVAVATLLFLTMFDWHAETIAAQLTTLWLNNTGDAVGVSVERSMGSVGAFTEITTTGPADTTYTDLTVTDGTTYCYRVRAFNPTAYSDYSTMACSIPAGTAGRAVVKMGPGSGTVVSVPTQVDAAPVIICGMSCSGTFASGITVTLTASPATGSTFAGWSGGGCTGTGTCTLTLTSTMIVTAAFNESGS